jgi:hypothetical protein
VTQVASKGDLTATAGVVGLSVGDVAAGSFRLSWRVSVTEASGSIRDSEQEDEEQ